MKGLGLLDEAYGKILITPFGRFLAEGKISKTEFSATIIRSLELPNQK